MTNNNKGGRPKKAEKEKISEFLKMGFRKHEMALIESAAENAGYRYISEFLRVTFLQLLVKGRVTFVNQSEVNSQLAADIHGLANNFNQVTKKMHESSFPEAYEDLSMQLLYIKPLIQTAIKELNEKQVQR